MKHADRIAFSEGETINYKPMPKTNKRKLTDQQKDYLIAIAMGLSLFAFSVLLVHISIKLLP